MGTMFVTVPVTVAVPATSANLGPGFDTFGLALSLEDEVTARVTGSGIRIVVTGEGAGEVPADAGHLIVDTMLRTFDRLGVGPPGGLTLTCLNRIPHARGLGSSSAAIVAGIVLARELVSRTNEAFDDRWALALAAELEGHPDNVAPCLLGGFTIAWTGAAGARAIRLEPAPGLHPVLLIPQTRGLTAQARAALPPTVPHADAAFNVARAALLVHALTVDPRLLLEATADRLHEPYRAADLPETAELVARLRADGVPAVVSGAGPSVLALPPGEEPVAPPGWCARSLSISATGARIVVGRHAEGDPVAAGLPS
jgi:homoserine kinase